MSPPPEVEAVATRADQGPGPRVTADRRAGGPHTGLHESLRRYRTMFERGSLAQLIVNYPSFRINAANTAVCAMTGFSAADLVGSDVGIMFPIGMSPVANTIERLVDGAEGYSAERVLQRRDGTMLAVQSTVSAVRDEAGNPVQLLVLFQDMTDQRAVEHERRRSEALVSAAIAALPVSFTTFDADLRLSFMAGGVAHDGLQPSDFLGKHISEITPDPATRASLEQALSGSETTSRTVVAGQTYLTLNAPIRGDGDDPVGVISVSTNVTTEVEAQAELRRAEEQTLFTATHDPLTGLPGRSAVVERLTALSAAGNGAGALLILDLDQFSVINDSLGHEIGDAVLLEVASRVSDAFPGLMIARLGGDQFAVVASNAVARAEAVEAAERVHAALEEDVAFAGHSIHVTASVGIAIDTTRCSSSTLIRDADSALSHAKDAGGGQFRLYDADMRRQVQDRLGMQGGLRAALRDGHFRLAYQPIVRLTDHRVIGAEALLRWTSPERGHVSPVDFIPVAEQTGLIVPLGQWVMRTACHDVLRLQREHGMYISVNISTRQLIGGRFADWVEEVLDDTGLPSCALMIEVTESSLMDNVSLIRAAFDRLRARGVRVAIDDFGVGYSSLARLQRLPVDLIKLDRAFVTDVDVRPEARAMAAAILQLSTAIGARVVAEGVETRAEAATLLDLGYTAAQGFLFARPMPVGELSAHLGRVAAGPPRPLSRIA